MASDKAEDKGRVTTIEITISEEVRDGEKGVHFLVGVKGHKGLLLFHYGAAVRMMGRAALDGLESPPDLILALAERQLMKDIEGVLREGILESKKRSDKDKDDCTCPACIIRRSLGDAGVVDPEGLLELLRSIADKAESGSVH